MPTLDDGAFRFVVDADTAVIFDLDDTLYKERQFQVSGFRAVLRSAGVLANDELVGRMLTWSDTGDNPLSRVSKLPGVTLSEESLLEVYRSHDPEISLLPGALDLLKRIRRMGGRLGLLTDGRSRTQRNKMRALGIGSLFRAVVISEEVGTTKPDLSNYQTMHEMLGAPSRTVLVADNPRKDFLTPNLLGWTSIQIMDDGSNIHPQGGNWPANHPSRYRVASLGHLNPVPHPELP